MNPFVDAYLQSDWLGKAIFLSLFALSALSWSLLIYKVWLFAQVERLSRLFLDAFSDQDPIGLQFAKPLQGRLLEVPHPLFDIYKLLKQNALKLISRNCLYLPHTKGTMSESDLALLEAEADSAIAAESRILEKNLFMLSTIVTLGPFLGLLGTVWGILLSFSQLQSKQIAASNAALLSGLSLALATTVVGLIVAIPALVGYNYLKNRSRDIRRDMEAFVQRWLASVEFHYPKPHYAETNQTLS
ncbi:MAG: putative TolQ protein [Chlamydiota bacterium]|jgi:biopolymer transport protein TolQ